MQNFLENLKAAEFWKSVDICPSKIWPKINTNNNNRCKLFICD